MLLLYKINTNGTEIWCPLNPSCHYTDICLRWHRTVLFTLLYQCDSHTQCSFTQKMIYPAKVHDERLNVGVPPRPGTQSNSMGLLPPPPPNLWWKTTKNSLKLVRHLYYQSLWWQVFIKMAAMKIVVGLYRLNNYFLCWIVTWTVPVVPLSIYFSMSVKIGPKIIINYTFSFQETELL